MGYGPWGHKESDTTEQAGLRFREGRSWDWVGGVQLQAGLASPAS